MKQKGLSVEQVIVVLKEAEAVAKIAIQPGVTVYLKRRSATGRPSMADRKWRKLSG